MLKVQINIFAPLYLILSLFIELFLLNVNCDYLMFDMTMQDVGSVFHDGVNVSLSSLNPILIET